MATLLSPFSRFSPLPLESSLPESLPSIPGENIRPLPLQQAGPQRSLRLTASCRRRPEGLDTSRCHPPLWPLPPSAACSGIGSSPSGITVLLLPLQLGAPMCCLRLEPSQVRRVIPTSKPSFLLRTQPRVPHLSLSIWARLVPMDGPAPFWSLL